MIKPILVKSKHDCGRKPSTDPDAVLLKKLRQAINNRLMSTFGSCRDYSHLGCSIAEFRLWVEAQFFDGITWDTWGKTWKLSWNPQNTTTPAHYACCSIQLTKPINSAPKSINKHELEAIRAEVEMWKERVLAFFDVCRGAKIRLTLVEKCLERALGERIAHRDIINLVRAINALGGQVVNHSRKKWVRHLKPRF